MIKILELKSEDFMKGISYQFSLALGGLFQTASNFDPFEKIGELVPSLTSLQLGDGTILIPITCMAHATSGLNGSYIFLVGNRDAGGNALYRLKVSDNSLVDYSTNIHKNLGGGATETVNGAIYYKGRIIYSQLSTGLIRSNTFTPTDGNDVTILSSSGDSSLAIIPFWFCPVDGYVYYGNHANAIGIITSVTGTSGNNASQFALASDMFPRGLCDDGFNLVIFADSNEAFVTDSSAKCYIYFWNRKDTLPTYAYSVDDSYLIGGRYVNGRVLFFGSKGIYACRAGSEPKLVYPLPAALLPKNHYSIDVRNNCIYWTSGTSAFNRVYGYGNILPGLPPILFQPYISDLANATIQSCLAIAGSKFYVGNANTKFWQANGGATRNTATIQTAFKTLSQPYKYSHTKTVLASNLASGGSVAVTINSKDDTRVISDTVTKSYSAATDAKQQLLFPATPASSNPVDSFEDIAVTVSTNANIKRVSVYATPQDDYSFNL